MLRRSTYKRIAAGLVAPLTACLLLVAPGFGAQSQSQPPAQPRAEVPEKSLYAFAKAYVKASRIFTVYEEKIRMTHDAERVLALQKEANNKMNQAVAEEGLTVQEYNKIYLAAQNDEALRDKVNQLIRETDSQ